MWVFRGLERSIYDPEAGLLEGSAQLAAGNFRKRGMSEIIERAEREMREEGGA